MKTNKQFINEIYQKYDEYTKEKQQEKKQIARKIVNIAAVGIVMFSAAIVFSENPVRNQREQQVHQQFNAMVSNDISLATIGTFENFYEIMKSKNKEETKELEDLREGVASDTVSKNEALADSTSSTTNIQVENVDESDVVKVDSRYIYYISEGKVVIIDAQKPENANKIAEINYKEEKFNPRELYVRKNKLIVIGDEVGEYTAQCRTVTSTSICHDIAVAPDFKTGMIIYDITNIVEPKETRRIMIEGNYISSRMIEDNIYFVASKYIYTSDVIRNEIKDLEQNDYKPKYQDTLSGQEEKCINYDRIYNLEETEDASYLMIAGVNIESKEEVDIQTFLGAGQYVYASEKNMYIAANKQKYNDNYKFENGTTYILKLGLENGKVRFKAEAEINGQINNQFSMDENGEYFRIATTSGKLWNIDENTSNNLYILNSELGIVGEITGFAKEEKIYSVRYVGDKAYVVTFKQTDPFFVIDLTNPVEPKILGELKLPGYSTYLHPYDENHIIGFGYETKENGTRVYTNGLKMVMFDITDFTNPQVLFKVNMGNRYTSADLLYNHKALLYSKEKNIIGFCLREYSKGKNNYRAVIYDIDLNKGFTQKGEITHITNNYKEEIERVVFVNNTYYTLSKELVKVANMETFEIIKEIKL